MNLARSSLNAVRWSALQSWGRQFIGLLVFMILARILSPSDFGLIAMAGTFIAFCEMFVDQGISIALVQRDRIDDGHLNTAFWACIATGMLLTGICWLGADQLAVFYGQPDLATVVRWLSLTILLQSLSAIQMAILRRELRFKPLAIRTLLGQVTGGTIGCLMALSGYGVWSLVGQTLANSSVQLLLLWFASHWRPSWEFSPEKFRDLFAFGANILGIRVLEFVNRQSDKLLIGYFLGPLALGLYAFAHRLVSTLLQLLTGVVSRVTLTSFSRLQKDIPSLRSAFYSVIELVSVATFPIITLLIAASPYIVPLLFGSKWESSVNIIQFLCMAAYIESIYYFNSDIMLSMGKPSWRLKMNILTAAVNLVGFIIAVRWGIVAVAMAYVIRAFLLAPIPLFLVRRLIGIEYRRYLLCILGPTLASLMLFILFSIIMRLWPPGQTLYALTVASVVGLATYSIIIHKFAPQSSRKLLRVARKLIS